MIRSGPRPRFHRPMIERMQLREEQRDVRRKPLARPDRQPLIVSREQMLALQLRMTRKQRRAGMELQIRQRHRHVGTRRGKQSGLGLQPPFRFGMSRKFENQAIVDIDRKAVPSDIVQVEMGELQFRKECNNRLA